MKIRTALVSILLIMSYQVMAEVITKEVTYTDGSIKMKGYLAYDDSYKGKRPGVLVVHEWWGHNEYARKRARMLASMGYRAMSVDMYGDGKLASHPKDAGKFSGAVKKNMPVAKKRFMAAYNYLASQGNVNKKKMGAIGYCFGGGIVLEMARRNVELDVVASFHGSLGAKTKIKKGTVKTKVLVLNGAADPMVKPESIAAFKKEMKRAGVTYKFVNYPGAKHAFTNPDADKFGKQFKIPLAYHAQADKKSWDEMKKFFKQYLD